MPGFSYLSFCICFERPCFFRLIRFSILLSRVLRSGLVKRMHVIFGPSLWKCEFIYFFRFEYASKVSVKILEVFLQYSIQNFESSAMILLIIFTVSLWFSKIP